MQEKKYLLMNQNKPVILFSVNDNGLFNISDISKNGILPYYIQKQKELSGKHIRYWLEKRCIPQLRPRRRLLLEEYHYRDTYELALSNCALSFNDSFWVKPEDSSLVWEDINFFENPYSNVPGLFLLGDESTAVTGISPDICTNGIQPKLWVKEGGLDYLLKFGRPPYYQEPINEVLSSEIALTFPFLNAVKYTEASYYGKTVSKCINFVPPGIELVNAFYMYDKEEDILGNIYFFLIQKCKRLGFDVEEYFNEMMLFDYVINNTDRNLGNIAFFRDMDTGEFIGPSPVYDNGNSMWFNEMPDIMNDKETTCKPFAENFKVQLKLIKNVKVNMPELKFYVQKMLNSFWGRLDEDRLEKMEMLINQRLNHIENRYVYQKTRFYSKKTEMMR